MKQRVFLCKHCQHELTPPRAGMRLQEVKSWFRYARCPHCKHELRIVEKLPEPVVPVATQQPLWTGKVPILRPRAYASDQSGNESSPLKTSPFDVAGTKRDNRYKSDWKDTRPG